MIEVFKLKVVGDEDDQKAVLKVIAERENYYRELFKNEPTLPRIKITYEGTRPLSIRILFAPARGKVVVVNQSGYGTASAVTKHAFKKLRRVAKNHFIKVKLRHRNQ
jgi:hypothetical protein